ncbi:MAG TPA: enoyl-CoA hydratase-related protein [Vicinamibacterales bacterium]|nr:enoyl-CoA hydratase-related protein [Vicinamibacterales bacterium]
MAYENLLVERDGAVLILTINRPAKLNALNAGVLADLGAAITEARGDDGVRAMIVTGAGEKAFVAGADIDELAKQSPVAGREHARTGQALFDRIEKLGKPVIAAVNGFALGGGCELAMACTLRLAADTAKFGQPEINLGLLPGYAGSQRLPRLVGRGRALELLLVGAPITADEAFRIGLVNRVVPAPQLNAEARALAQTLAAKPAVAVRYILDAVASGLDMSFSDGQDYEATLFGLVATTDDMREGTRAFLEKRKPVFQGR